MNYGQRKTTTTLDQLSESFMGVAHTPHPAARKGSGEGEGRRANQVNRCFE